MSLGTTTRFGPLPPEFNVYIDGYGALTVDGFTAPFQPATLTEFLMIAVDETDATWWGTESVSGSPIGTIPTGFSAVGGYLGRPYSKNGKALNAVSTAGGSGYTKATITFTGDGSGASGHCVISGGAVQVVMDSGGFGYTSGSAFIVGDGDGGAAVTTHVWPLGVGDFLIYNDESDYEICQIISIDEFGTMSVYRSVLGSGNSSGRTHYLRCVTNIVSKLSPPNVPPIIPLRFKMGWENLCVVGMSATCGASATIINLGSNTGRPGAVHRPGLRTMSGAAYTELTATGNLSIGQTADWRTTIQEWQTVRCVYGVVGTPSKDTDIIICVCAINSAGGVLVIDGITIKQGSTFSFNAIDAPDGRQMPYHDTNVYATQPPDQDDWPPNILPAGNKGIDPHTGKLIAPQQAKPGAAGWLTPDTEIDFVINQVGSSGHTGADLRVVFQT